MKRMENFKAGFIRENPIFGLYLGLCSVLAVSTSLNNALGMGVAVIIVTILSNVIISAIRKITPNEIRIPVYIVVIAALVKSIQLLIQAYAHELYAALGIFLPLIVVNCIILGRAEAFASKNGVLDSALDGLGMGLGYTVGIVIMSIIRQVFSTGILVLTNPFDINHVIFFSRILPEGFEISLFRDPFGAFITFACLAAALTAFQQSKNKKAWKISMGAVALVLVALVGVNGKFNYKLEVPVVEAPVENTPVVAAKVSGNDEEIVALTGAIDETIDNGDGTTTYKVNAKGYAAFESGKNNGFTVVVDETGAIQSIEVTEFNDTAYIGDKIINDTFLGQFKGLTSTDFEVDVEAGATVTSKSAIKAIQLVLESLGK